MSERGPYPVAAYRLVFRKDQPKRFLCMRTGDWPTMEKWLTRSTAARRHGRKTLWVEEETRPGVSVAMTVRKRWGRTW